MARNGWSGVRDPRAYLYRAVSNEAHNHRRSRQRRWIRDVHAVLPPFTTPAAEHDDVRRAVEGLSVRQRAVVYLAYWRDLPEPQIAVLLGLSTSSVRRHLERATAHLRKALQ